MLSLVGAGLGVALVQASLCRLGPPGVRFFRLPEAIDLKLQIHRLARR